jgi:pimeloyl-ACP methyl ester carboxylesterase
MILKTILAALTLLAAPAVVAAQPSLDPAGDWRGTLTSGAISLRVALHLSATASSFDSLDQGALGLPAKMTVNGAHVVVTVDKLGVIEGDLSPDGQTLTAALKQGPNATPLVLQRGIFTAAYRPQTPIKPYPYREVDARYDNPARPGVHLAGTLTVPMGKGPFPTALLITGSGAQDRDETIFEHKPFLVLADALTRRGIAVLRVDDRGMGGTTGATLNDTTQDFATDVEAGVAWLKTRPEVDRARIGLIGHSEGGVIAPMVAQHDPSIAFVVLWAGPGVSGAEIISEQVRMINLAAGIAAPVAEANGKAQAKLLAAIIAAPDATSARAAASKTMAEIGAPPPNATTLAQLTSPWYRAFIAYDPAPTLRALQIPVLALLGGRDTQVSAVQNGPALRAALSGDPKAKVVELPDLNHLFQTAASGGVEEYGKIEETVAPLALKTIGDWIVGVVGPPAH